MSTRSPTRDPLREQATAFVLDLITSRDLRPNDALPSESKLAAMIGVSRVVIREACRTLAARGILRIEHGRGMFVAEPSPIVLTQYIDFALRRNAKLFDDLLEVRLSLEAQAAELAALRRRSEHIQRLQRLLDETEANFDDFEKLAVADVDFHNAILEASGNSLLGFIGAGFERLLIDSRRLTYAGALRRGDGVRVASEGHRRILDAIEAQNAKAAGDAMRTHLAQTANDLATAHKMLRSVERNGATANSVQALLRRETEP